MPIIRFVIIIVVQELPVKKYQTAALSEILDTVHHPRCPNIQTFIHDYDHATLLKPLNLSTLSIGLYFLKMLELRNVLYMV
jgi:hypothetical protein